MDAERVQAFPEMFIALGHDTKLSVTDEDRSLVPDMAVFGDLAYESIDILAKLAGIVSDLQKSALRKGQGAIFAVGLTVIRSRPVILDILVRGPF